MEHAKHSKGKHKKNKGAATTEFAISLLFFVPLFVAVPLIGKYISFKHKNIESTRYAVWERTVWADPQGRWNDNENTKSAQTLADEVDVRFYGSQRQAISNNTRTNNQLWVDRKSQQLLSVPPKGPRINVTTTAGLSPVKNHFVDQFAYKGMPVVGSMLTSATNLINSTLGRIVPSCQNFPGVDFKRGMNLGSRTYASISVTARAKNLLPIKKTGQSQNNQNNQNNNQNNLLTFTSSGSILSNAWTAPTESLYKQRVGKLVIDEAVKCIATPATWLGWLPPYKEGKAAKNVASAAKTTVLLSNYKK